MTAGTAQISSRSKLLPKRPSMFDALGEFRVPLEASIYWLGALTHPWPRVSPRNAQVVMLIPGFMAGEIRPPPPAEFFPRPPPPPAPPPHHFTPPSRPRTMRTVT